MMNLSMTDSLIDIRSLIDTKVSSDGNNAIPERE
jgi:hypothetical protein